LALDIKNTPAQELSEEEKSEIMQYAIDQILKNIEGYPNDAQQYMYLMNLYFIGSKYDIDRLKYMPKAGAEALKLSPTRPQIYYLLGQGAVGQKKYDTAVAHFQKAVDLNPSVFDSHWNLAVALRFAGRKEEEMREYEALERLGLRYEDKEALDDINLLRLSQKYISLKDYEKLVGVYETLVMRNPRNVEYLGNYAGALKSVGDTIRAREVANQIIELNPAAAEEVEKFLSELEKEE